MGQDGLAGQVMMLSPPAVPIDYITTPVSHSTAQMPLVPGPVTQPMVPQQLGNWAGCKGVHEQGQRILGRACCRTRQEMKQYRRTVTSTNILENA